VFDSTGSLAAFLEPLRKFHQRQLGGVTDSFQLQHVYSSFSLFVLADTCLRDAEDLGNPITSS